MNARERLPFEVFHGEVERTFVLAELEVLDHVRMRDLRGDPRFIEKHIPEAVVARVLLQDALDHDRSLEPTWTRQPAEQDLRHAADGQLPHDLVAPDGFELDPRFCHPSPQHRGVSQFHDGRLEKNSSIGGHDTDIVPSW